MPNCLVPPNSGLGGFVMTNSTGIYVFAVFLALVLTYGTIDDVLTKDILRSACFPLIFPFLQILIEISVVCHVR